MKKNKSRLVVYSRLQVNTINRSDSRNNVPESLTEDDCNAAADFTGKSFKSLPMQRKAIQPRSLKVALYSHDTMGLGHIRRNMTIARTLAGPDVQASVLLITGANIATGFEMPQGVDCVTLPAIRKDRIGNYHSNSLDLPLHELISIRAKIIHGAVAGFKPDVLIVDNVPHGVKGELDETLEFLRSHGGTRCVLGLRDILDAPDVVRNEWQKHANEDCIRRCYDSIWVYGDPAIYDPVQEYYGEMVDPELSNLRIATVGTGIRPTRKTSLDLVYYNYRQVEASTLVRDWEIDMDPDGHSTDIGYEIDLVLGYRIQPHHKGNVIVGSFHPGKAFRNDAENALFVELKLQYEF